jgi:phosphate acyltransferase
MSAPSVRVALDLLGGDGAPDVVVDGALIAAQQPGIEVLLVGPPEIAERLLTAQGAAGRLAVVPAYEAVDMAEDPVRAVRAKKDATVRVAAKLVRDGRAEAAVSAGSTGALVVAAVFALGRLPGVTRPAIAVTVPSPAGPVVLVDAGANVECSADMLAQFALAGAAYARTRFGVPDPKVGLLCNGTEPRKGDTLRRDALATLAALPVNLVGFVESDAVTSGGTADVVVTDGFTGNILLKGIEGMHALAQTLVRREVPDPAAALAALAPLSPDHLGGAILLGVPGTVVVGHGNAGSEAIAACIVLAADAVRQRLVPRVAETMADLSARRRAAAGLAAAAPH